MANHTYEVDAQHGAEMDYSEHEKTYSRFLALTKWGVVVNIVLLIAMAVGLLMGGGLVGGVLTFIVLMIAARIIL